MTERKLNEDVMQANEWKNESKQSGHEIILQEIKPVSVCANLGRESGKGVTELIWDAGG